LCNDHEFQPACILALRCAPHSRSRSHTLRVRCAYCDRCRLREPSLAFVQPTPNLTMSFARASIGGKSAIAMAAAQKREAFSFPFLEAPAIVAHLHEMGIIGVEEDDITKGRPEAVRYLYEQLIYACTGLTREALYTPRLVEDSLGPIPRFPELHDEAISMLHFLRAL